MATTRCCGTLPVSLKEVFGVEGSATTTDMTMDFLAFGPVPKIELPQQDEIYDATGRVESELKSAAEAP